MPRSEYSQAERIGEQIVRLIAMFAMHLMGAERERLKLFSFDEGWRLLGDPVGRALLASLQRMGRSELAVPIISTQLVSDTLMGERESLDNLLGATFVFGMRSEAEAGRALALLGLDPEDRRMRQTPARARGRALPVSRPPRSRRGDPGRRRRAVAAARLLDHAARARERRGARADAATPCSAPRRGAWRCSRPPRRGARRRAAAARQLSAPQRRRADAPAATPTPRRRRRPRARAGEPAADRRERAGERGEGERSAGAPTPRRSSTRWWATGSAARCATARAARRSCSRGEQRNCETSGFVAAAAPTGDYGIDVHIDTGVLGLSGGWLLSPCRTCSSRRCGRRSCGRCTRSS